jgi:hypothetical protein
MAQMICGSANICPNGVGHQRVNIRFVWASQQRFDRRANAVHDGAQVVRLSGWTAEQVFERRQDSPALGVAHDDYQASPVSLRREFDAADLRRRDHVSSHADDEEIPKALVENEFRWDARIRAAKHNREWRLPRHQCGATDVIRDS